jgi:hypothetical protein
MRGKGEPKPPRPASSHRPSSGRPGVRRGLRHRAARVLACAALAAVLLALVAAPVQARELRRQMPYIRALLMGDAYVAVADESSVLFYNPAGLASLKEGTFEISPLHFSADKQLTDLLLNPEDVKAQYQNLTPTELAEKINTSLYSDLSLRVPFIYAPKQGSAYGLGAEVLGAAKVVTDSLGLPALQLEAFADETVFYSNYGKIGPLSLGYTAKVINRAGIDKTIDFATLYATGQLSLESDPDFLALANGERRLRGGLDLGLVYEFYGAENWRPRFGLAALNIGGYNSTRRFYGIEFSKRPDPKTRPVYGELPLNVVAGFAVSPTYGAIRYTFDMDLVDIAKTALEGDSLKNRLRTGFELGIGPHADGTALFSLLFGFNTTHFSVGILTRVSIFEIGFGRYAVEKGRTPGEDPEERRVLVIAFRI